MFIASCCLLSAAGLKSLLCRFRDNNNNYQQHVFARPSQRDARAAPFDLQLGINQNKQIII
jgi:hypothetical protein